jgi:hypothetical protein
MKKINLAKTVEISTVFARLIGILNFLITKSK